MWVTRYVVVSLSSDDMPHAWRLISLVPNLFLCYYNELYASHKNLFPSHLFSGFSLLSIKFNKFPWLLSFKMQFYFEVINFKLKLRQIQQFVNFTKGKLYGHIQQRILRTQKKTKKSSQNKKTQHIKRVFCLHVLNCFVYLMSLIILLLLLLLLFPSIFFASILDQKIARRRRKRIE